MTTGRRGRPAIAEGESRRLRERYRALLARHPLFTPHAEVCFETLDSLGEGGMGRVLRIRDQRLGREAALKLLNANNNQRSRERFTREARVTARLAHPSIPPIYEAGETAEGELYLLMKVIEGRTLAEMISSAHRSRAPAAIRELVEVLVKVCEALAYAHSQGVVHRDLKPENLMVGRFGEVMVMDWGIARDLSESIQTDHSFVARHSQSAGAPSPEDARLTRGGAVLGTPGFMAPEQARGEDVDARADIFSLGAILTEAITGKSAIAGESAQGRQVATLEGYVRSPRGIDPACDRELDFIAGRCLAMKRHERWADCQQLKEALKAWLEGRPIPGYRYSLAARGLRALRRRPLALVLSLFGLGLVSALAMLDGALKTRRLARAQAKTVSAALDKSQARQRRSEAAARRAQRVLALFEEARGLARREPQRLDALLSEALEAGERSAGALLTAAEICGLAEKRAEQTAFLKEAVERHPPGYEALLALHLLETGGELELDSRYKKELIEKAEERGDEDNELVLVSRAYSAYNAGDYERVIELCTRAEALSERLAMVYALRAEAWSKRGLAKRALEDYDRAVAVDPEYPQVYNNRGVSRRNCGMLEEAADDFSKAIDLAPGYALAYKNRGEVYFELGEDRGALKDLNRAIALRPGSVEAHACRADLHERAGRYADALRDYNRLIELQPSSPVVYNNRGFFFAKRGRLDRALADYDKAIELRPGYHKAYANRGDVFERMGDWARAEANYSELLALHPDSPLGYFYRGLARYKQHRPAEARADFEKAIELKPDQAMSYNARGVLLREAGDLDGALRDFSKAIDLAPDYALAHNNRGLTLALMGRAQEGLRDLRAAIELSKDPEEIQSFEADLQGVMARGK